MVVSVCCEWFNADVFNLPTSLTLLYQIANVWTKQSRRRWFCPSNQEGQDFDIALSKCKLLSSNLQEDDDGLFPSALIREEQDAGRRWR